MNKDSTEAELAKWRNRVLSGHDQIKVAGADAVDMEEIARTMAQTSSTPSASFAADMQVFGSGERLQEILAGKDAEEEGQAESDDDNEEAEEGDDDHEDPKAAA